LSWFKTKSSGEAANFMDDLKEQRQKKLKELYNEMSSIRAESATGGGTENPYKIRNVRRAIARILTIQREEELEASK